MRHVTLNMKQTPISLPSTVMSCVWTYYLVMLSFQWVGIGQNKVLKLKYLKGRVENNAGNVVEAMKGNSTPLHATPTADITTFERYLPSPMSSSSNPILPHKSRSPIDSRVKSATPEF